MVEVSRGVQMCLHFMFQRSILQSGCLAALEERRKGRNTDSKADNREGRGQ